MAAGACGCRMYPNAGASLVPSVNPYFYTGESAAPQVVPMPMSRSNAFGFTEYLQPARTFSPEEAALVANNSNFNDWGQPFEYGGGGQGEYLAGGFPGHSDFEGMPIIYGTAPASVPYVSYASSNTCSYMTGYPDQDFLLAQSLAGMNTAGNWYKKAAQGFLPMQEYCKD